MVMETVRVADGSNAYCCRGSEMYTCEAEPSEPHKDRIDNRRKEKVGWTLINEKIFLLHVWLSMLVKVFEMTLIGQSSF